MTAISFIAPIPEGKTEAPKEFFREAQGPRGRELHASRSRLQVTEDQAWIQSTPVGHRDRSLGRR